MGRVGDFSDNADKHIIAFDFDGTLTMVNEFPDVGEPRPFAKEIVNFLYDMGVIILIWTCRDKNDEYDDITPMVEWLDEHGFKYHDINTCIGYAPFHYEARKIYAHMYVDDRAFGWNESDTIMLDVLDEFMRSVMGVDILHRHAIINGIYRGEELDTDGLKEHIY